MVNGIQLALLATNESGPMGGMVTAVKRSSRTWPRKYTGKRRFWRVVKADRGRALKQTFVNTKDWYSSVPKSEE